MNQWGKSHVSPPCLIQLPPLKTTFVSWGSYGWEWSVAGLSVLAHTHTPPTNQTSHWAEEMTTPIISTLSTTVLKTLRTFDSPFCIVTHSHARKNVRCLTHRILPGFYSRSELGAMFFHPRFPYEGPFTFFLLCVCFP